MMLNSDDKNFKKMPIDSLYNLPLAIHISSTLLAHYYHRSSFFYQALRPNRLRDNGRRQKWKKRWIAFTSKYILPHNHRIFGY